MNKKSQTMMMRKMLLLFEMTSPRKNGIRWPKKPRLICQDLSDATGINNTETIFIYEHETFDQLQCFPKHFNEAQRDLFLAHFGLYVPLSSMGDFGSCLLFC